MPESVIKRIAEIADRENQREYLILTERNGNAILNHNVKGDGISIAGVDIETDNETDSDDSSENENKQENENENENRNENESNNQPFITDNDEQPLISMEYGEGTPQEHAETS
jgi:hypothetical protein